MTAITITSGRRDAGGTRQPISSGGQRFVQGAALVVGEAVTFVVRSQVDDR